MPRLLVPFMLLWSCQAGPEVPEPTTWSHLYFVDPTTGDDAADGLTEATALRSLARFDVGGPRHLAVKPNTRIALKRGSVLRLTATVQLHGHDLGWVAYGSYGDPSLPKPIVLGSVGLEASSWSAPDENGVRTLDWSPYLDPNGGRSADGVEQGPGNLWFFEGAGALARMQSWAWRKKDPLGRASLPGDFYYDNTTRRVHVQWPGAAPTYTEASINRFMFDLSGQSHVVIEDLDLRYGGNYAIKGHELKHVRVRRVDVSFIGGGTKSRVDGKDQYVRLGNGFEVFGNGEDVVVENCRVHQAYDSGLDPQYVGSSKVSMDGLVLRGNLISYVGLAGIELWERPDAPASGSLRNVTVEQNTLLSVGRGWGYEQHDHAGQAKIGAALLTSTCRGTASNVVIRRNVIVAPRAVVATDFHPETRDFFRAFAFDENLWDLSQGGEGVVLFEGETGTLEADLTGSPVFHDLASWQANTEVRGQDAHSVQGAAGFDRASDPVTEDLEWISSLPVDDALRPTRLGPFALTGDYRRTSATNGAGWGAAIAP